MRRYCCNCRRCRAGMNRVRNRGMAGRPAYGIGFGSGYGGFSFPMLILLILIVLQFGRREHDEYCEESFENSPILDNGILFIIAFFFLVCGCGYGRGLGLGYGY